MAQEQQVPQTGMQLNNQNPDLQAEGTTAFGSKVADVINEELDAQADRDYFVSEVEFNGKQAVVNYFAADLCRLVLAIYNDEGTLMVGSANALLMPEESEITLDVNIDEMPETFLIKAFLLDSETNNPLTEAYESEKYTREFQDFLAKTTEDFAKEQVLNLDENEETNFAVFQEGTIHAAENEATNHLISENENTYIIENADESIQNLKKGDIFHFTADGEEKIIKVEACTVSASDGKTTVTLTESEAELEELFDYIKIETDCSEAEIETDASDLEEGLTYLGMEKETHSMAGNTADLNLKWLNYKYEKEIKTSSSNGSASANAKLEMNLSLNVNGKLNFYYNGLTKITVDVTLTPSINGTLKASAKLEKDIKLTKIGISPIAGVYLTITPTIELRASAAIEYNFSIGFTIGCGWAPHEGISNKSKAPKITSELQVEGKLYIGLNMKPAITIISKKVLEFGLDAKAGLELSGKLLKTNQKDEDTQHACNSCIDGDFKFKAEIAANIDFLKKLITLNVTFWKYDKKLGDFYFSLDDQKGGLGECPRHLHKVVVTVVNKDGKALEGISVYKKGGDGVIRSTDANGQTVFFLRSGSHTIIAENTDGQKSEKKKVKVSGKKAEVKFKVDWTPAAPPQTTDNPNEGEASEFDKTAHGAETASGNCGAEGDNVKYILYEDGTLYVYGKGAIKDYEWNDDIYYDPDEGGILSILDNKGLSVKNIHIDTGVTKIGVAAFNNYNYTSKHASNNLISVKIAPSVTDIGDHAFYGCNNLVNITVPSSVTYIGGLAFDCTSWLEKKRAENPLVIVNQIALDGQTCSGEIIIPEYVTSIAGGAFIDCENLASITIPDSVTLIGEQTFNACHNLTSITIPDSVTSIESGTFRDCYSLTNITIPGSVTSIGDSAFRGCPNLTISAPSGSYAESYAKENNIPFQPLIRTASASVNALSAQTANTDLRSYAYHEGTPAKEYLFVAVKDKEADDLFNASNLLYIDQKTADETGSVAFEYMLADANGSYQELIFGETAPSENNPPDKNPSETTPPDDNSIRGDLDGNGKIDLSDAQLSLKFALAILTPQPKQKKPADINQDGKINLDDSLMILKIALGIEKAPNSGQDIPTDAPSSEMPSSPTNAPSSEAPGKPTNVPSSEAPGKQTEAPSGGGEQIIAENITYTASKIPNGIVCIVKNSNPYAVALNAESVFYQGTSMLDMRSDDNPCLEANSECVLFFLAPFDENYDYLPYDDYKITFTLEKLPENLVHDANHIAVKSNFGVENVMAEVTNNSDKDFDFIHTTLLYYDAKDNIIDIETNFAKCTAPGSVDNISYFFPIDGSTYKTITPDHYKIFVDYAYKYIV